MRSILITAAEARRETRNALIWRGELTRIALDIKDATYLARTQIRVDKVPEGPVREALLDAGYLLDFAADGLTISWIRAQYESTERGSS